MQVPYLMAIFRVHLQEAKDIADIDVLSDIAAEVGMMTKAEVRRRCASKCYTDRYMAGDRVPEKRRAGRRGQQHV
jgi:predicted DsbA family dithiol-disulfide isomerase